jgi:hypothetical protein
MTIIFLALSLIGALSLADGLTNRSVLLTILAIAIVIGFLCSALGLSWASKLFPIQPMSNDNHKPNEAVTIETYDDISHEVVPDRQGIYFLGEKLGFTIKLTNLLSSNCTKDFSYIIQLPDHIYLSTYTGQLQFGPNEIKTMRLGREIFLAFEGVFRVVVITPPPTNLPASLNLPQATQFLTLFVGYSRDRKGFNLQRDLLGLTSQLKWLTVILVVLTVLLFIFGLIEVSRQSVIYLLHIP